MKKVIIESKLSSEEDTLFSGKGILKGNELIFYEDKVKTKIKFLDEKVIIERSKDYFIKMQFIRSKKSYATYTMGDKNFYLEIFTKKLEIGFGRLLINYDLTLSDNEKINFVYNVKYSIDS